MKEFIKNVGATVVGIFVFTILVGAIGMMSLVGMVASGSSAKDVADNTVFVINLEGQLQERSVDNPFSQYLGGAASTIGLDDLLDGIKKAKENDKIKGIYIEAGAFAPDSYASLQAVRKALVDFKKRVSGLLPMAIYIPRLHIMWLLLQTRFILIRADR